MNASSSVYWVFAVCGAALMLSSYARVARAATGNGRCESGRAAALQSARFAPIFLLGLAGVIEFGGWPMRPSIRWTLSAAAIAMMAAVVFVNAQTRRGSQISSPAASSTLAAGDGGPSSRRRRVRYLILVIVLASASGLAWALADTFADLRGLFHALGGLLMAGAWTVVVVYNLRAREGHRPL